jgi:flagellar hook-associated protein 1 FlgK
MWDITHIGMSSLIAFKAALSVTSGNVANANSPNFSRRSIDLSTGPFGVGVLVADVRRVFDDHANENIQTTNSGFGMYETSMQQLATLEKLFSGNGNVGKLLTDSYATLQDLNRDTNIQNRTLYLTKLNNLTQQFHSVSSQIVTEQKNINQSLQAITGNVNQILGNIADINRLISTTTADNDAANALLDQRQGLLEKLSSFVNINSSIDNHNVMTISLTNGMPILVGDQATEFTTMTDAANSENLVIGIKSGSTNLDITSLIKGGKIAGYTDYRNQLAMAEQTLGRISLALTDTFNTQNKKGLDANGAWGADIFNDINSTLAIASRVRANQNNVGTSSMSVKIDAVKNLQASDYQLVMGASNSYVLTRRSDNTTVATGTFTATFPQTISVDGFSLTLASGTFTAGDKYIISPTNNASEDMNVATNNPSKIALGWAVTAANGTKQEGSTGQIAVTDITNPSNSSFTTAGTLTPPIQIKFFMSGGVLNYNVLDITDPNAPLTLAGPIAYNTTTANVFPAGSLSYDPGYRVSLSGTIQAGDTFNISYNDKITSDNRNGKALADLYNAGVIQNGTMTFNQGYTALSTDVATKSKSAQVSYDASVNLKTTAENARDAISGVSIEEEMMNLVRYQQSYQASAQIIQSAKAVFDIVIGMTR